MIIIINVWQNSYIFHHHNETCMTKLPVFDTLFSVSCLSPPCRPPFFETSVVVEADPWAWYANKGPCPTSDASPVFLRVKTYATNEKKILWTIENMLKHAKRFGWFVLHTSWILDVCHWAFGELISRFLILVQWAKQHHIGIALKLQIMSLWHAWFKLVGLHREVSSNSNSRVCTPKLLWFKHNKQWSFHRFRTAFRNTILKIKNRVLQSLHLRFHRNNGRLFLERRHV